MPVSVLILTLDEESNLPRCLDALSWCDDIVVLDSYSSDKTCQVARDYGARVFQRKFDNFASQRNYALDNIEFHHDWVLHLDADEVVTRELRDEILDAVKEERFDAYRIAPKLIFMDKWLRYSGMYPCYQVRLGRKDILRFEQVGHGQREELRAGRIGTLRESYLHYNFSKGIEEWLARHDRYATQEAENALARTSGRNFDWKGLVHLNDPVRRRRALKELSFRLPCRSTLRFLYMYILKRGFLDGRPGLEYCRLLAKYEGKIALKMSELQTKRPGNHE